ncbi:riboflavin kinase/FMN adenylyltransferase [Mesoflavibacter sabulilitoris]|uniref:Riboflavin biosynthesis protein n=1 Tax=Mesoflavibacter zeaxanthinifaciens subsp. sabulilitoris TaxID=1520893 RepID=A0A2T1NI60_9FLAO|nr:riboflavin kinase/FMN adenylyltransferase [Mesoflavibacter zeaxanthinifaciens subsp. sabulilitoris]PSG92603.1 riboflavin biosynthesis protein RibF [Mesoflavibacter zeaxanthinifaciens subsp. sabulilitoris]
MKNKSSNHTVLTIGTFDGVHIGHQKIIKRLVEISEIKNLTPSLLTFFPHPRMVLQKDANIKLINTIDEKKDILNQFGISNLVIKEFTKEFSRLTAEDFVKNILVDHLKAKHIIIGYDHHFGRNRNANIEDLKQFGNDFDFEVEEISKQDINDVAVSSTKIRAALQEGNIKTANTYLGYNFMLTGKVIDGKKLGQTINYPTANLHIEETYKLIPKHGVYIVKSIIDNITVYGMMNIGHNPTVNGKHQTIETHFFDFNKDLYGQNLKIELLQRLRNEQKFSSVEELQSQLHIDKNNALEFIKSHA